LPSDDFSVVTKQGMVELKLLQVWDFNLVLVG